MDILRGIKVIDITAWAFVPSAGGVLAHWGADVIKVESPTAPDPMRLLDGTLEPGRASTYFKHYSRGKRSVALNLATPEGREILYALAADADVFLTSYLPDVRRKLEIDVEHIRAINPRIVYARGSGQGPKGPDRARPGYDGITWWCRGSLAQSAMDVSGARWPTGMVGHGDGMSGMTLAGGICAALLHRERTGHAPVVDASLLGTAVWFNGPALIAAQFTPQQREFGPVEPSPSRLAGSATSGAYQTRDHRFVNLSLDLASDVDRVFADFCDHVGKPELAADERFARAADRLAHRQELHEILAGVFAARTLEEWKVALATTEGAWSPVSTPEEVYEDPQTQANGFLRHVDYPGGGLKVPVPPVLFDEEAGDPPRAPDFAEHTDEVLAALGYGAAEVERLRAAGVVA